MIAAASSISGLYAIGPEEPEYGGPGEIVTVMTRIDSQRPFAYLFRAEGVPKWELLINDNWKIVVNLKYLEGSEYSQWEDALPELESALDGPWDLNAGRYAELANIYEKTADLIDENNWTQFANARDQKGNKVLYNSDDAYSYCLTGALAKLDRPRLFLNLLPLVKYLGLMPIESEIGSLLSSRLYLLSVWNDSATRTRDQVTGALRGAASQLRQAHSEGRDYF